MKTLQINQQRSRDSFWIDENGTKIPYNRTTRSERITERHAAGMFQKALKLHTALKEFKQDVIAKCNEIAEAVRTELDSSKEHKGNFTFYNFDRSVKIEVSVSARIEFDDLTLSAAKEKLDVFLNENVTGDDVVKQMVLDAFSKSRGRLDVKKVLSLLKYRSRIKDKRFSEALDLIEKSIRRPESKMYFRIWGKDDSGSYQNLDLNFSSVEP